MAERWRSPWLSRALFQVHLWLGLLTGLYILIVCTTGAALVFRIDMQRALHPALFTPSAEGPLADAATILEHVRDAYPNHRVSGIDAPTTTRPTYLAYVTQGDRFVTLLIDPVTARVLGELPEQSAVRTLQDLHYDLLAGRTGRVVNGAGAACLLLMCLTGLVIWWPGAGGWWRAMTVDFSRTWKRVNWELHGAIGFWMAVMIAMWATTGLYFAFPASFRSAVNALSPLTSSRTPASDPGGAAGSPLAWRALIEKAASQVPDRAVARVVLPGDNRGAFQVSFSKVRPTPAGTTDLTTVYLDQYRGSVLQSPQPAGRTAGDIVMAWVAPLHVGSFGGNAVRVAWFVLGLSPGILFVTGFIMWWTRVVRRRRV